MMETELLSFSSDRKRHVEIKYVHVFTGGTYFDEKNRGDCGKTNHAAVSSHAVDYVHFLNALN